MASSSRAYGYTLPPEFSGYEKGGYHDIFLGDSLGKYKVVGKLGWGAFSTIWAVEDETQDSRRLSRPLVAVKVMQARISDVSREQDILQRLHTEQSEHAGRCHISSVLDSFFLHGQNGIHRCLVFPTMGISTSDAPSLFSGDTLPMNIIRVISKQVLQGLDFIHSQGITHGDLHSGNICFTVSQDDIDREALSNPMLSPPGAPPHSENIRTEPIISQSLVNCDEKKISVKILDFGEAFSTDEQQDYTPNTPYYHRAPEFIHRRGRLDHKIDIWSFGCLMSQFIIGEPLFCTGISAFPNSQADVNKKYKALVQKLLKPRYNFAVSPRNFATREFAKHLFDERKKYREDNRWLDAQEDEEEKFEMDEGDLQLGDLLRNSTLAIKPEHRKEARELLSHIWFSSS